jgi:hypothetical protein
MCAVVLPFIVAARSLTETVTFPPACTMEPDLTVDAPARVWLQAQRQTSPTQPLWTTSERTERGSVHARLCRTKRKHLPRRTPELLLVLCWGDRSRPVATLVCFIEAGALVSFYQWKQQKRLCGRTSQASRRSWSGESSCTINQNVTRDLVCSRCPSPWATLRVRWLTLTPQPTEHARRVLRPRSSCRWSPRSPSRCSARCSGRASRASSWLARDLRGKGLDGHLEDLQWCSLRTTVAGDSACSGWPHR